MIRTLTPELLDSLPPDSPAARHSRRDLVLINRVMGNHRWFTRTVPPLARPGERALELGAGDGALALALRDAGLPTDALDRFPAPAGWSTSSRWHVADLRAFAGWDATALVAGNLILHHLADDELAALGATLDSATGARVLVFNEPLRAARSRLLLAAGCVLGRAHPVTRHDGRVSIAAGFRGDELPRALGLAQDRWSLRVATTFFGAYRLVAVRRA